MPIWGTRTENILNIGQSRFKLLVSPPPSQSKVGHLRIKAMNELVFKNQKITPIIVNGQPYLGVQQIAVALQYNRYDIVSQLYNRHADEFSSDMSFLTTTDTAGGKQQIRVFSLRGCHLLAMFSKTPVAKEFRKWVLDLIESRNATMQSPALDAKAIGGIVKKYFSKAVREELANTRQKQPEISEEERFILDSLRAYAKRKYEDGMIAGLLEGAFSQSQNSKKIRQCFMHAIPKSKTI